MQVLPQLRAPSNTLGSEMSKHPVEYHSHIYILSNASILSLECLNVPETDRGSFKNGPVLVIRFMKWRSASTVVPFWRQLTMEKKKNCMQFNRDHSTVKLSTLLAIKLLKPLATANNFSHKVTSIFWKTPGKKKKKLQPNTVMQLLYYKKKKKVFLRVNRTQFEVKFQWFVI